MGLNDIEKKSINNNYNFQKKNVKEILTNSVEEQLLSSDTETSVMLSSGIDSSLVTSIASKIKIYQLMVLVSLIKNLMKQVKLIK